MAAADLLAGRLLALMAATPGYAPSGPALEALIDQCRAAKAEPGGKEDERLGWVFWTLKLLSYAKTPEQREISVRRGLQVLNERVLEAPTNGSTKWGARGQ